MSDSERSPLVLPSSKREFRGVRYNAAEDGYLLLSVPQNEDKPFIRKLNNIGNYSGTIVAVSAVVIIVLLIVGVTYHADTSQLVGGTNTSKDVKEASPKLTQSGVEESTTNNPRRTIDIDTPFGTLRGYVRKSRKGREFLAFYRVPFAKPPVKELRFKDPQPAVPWNGIRDSPEPGARCPQIKHGEFMGDEDCLYAQIYVPLTNDDISANSFPTMVYIHGGGFGTGGIGYKYGGEYFMDEDVVLITFEYRVRLLGFLNTGDREATGNMGFKDMVMMLKWVKSNIRSFGGDPNRVTVFGNSAGAFSIGFLLVSPMANGLVHRAISQSGTCFTNSWKTIEKNPEVIKETAAKAFNCPSTSSEELVRCLQQVDMKDLTQFDSPEGTNYGLTVEHGFDSNDLSEVFMPEMPYKRLKNGRISRIPYMVGVMSTELAGQSLGYLASKNITEALNSNFSQLAPEILEFDLTPMEANLLKRFYFGDKKIGMETERNLTNLLSDRVYAHGSKVAASFHSQYSDNTYLFYMSKTAKQSIIQSFLEALPEFDSSDIVSHADEVQFLFPYPDFPYYPPTDTEYFPFSEFLVRTWAYFATTGRPIPESEANWPALNPDAPNATYWFELNDQAGLTPVLNERMQFWDKHFSHRQLLYDL